MSVFDLRSSISNLNTIEGKDLRKLSLLEVLDREDFGAVYFPFLRPLQLKPDRYQSFYETSLNEFRRRDDVLDYLRRGNQNDLKLLTGFFVRCYGCVHWGDDRDWVLEKEDLADDEVLLNYEGPQGNHEHFHNALKPLWQQLRNIMFVESQFSRRWRRRSVAPPQSETKNSDGEVIKAWSAERTEEAIVKLLADSERIKMLSEQETFDRLWDQYGNRFDERIFSVPRRSDQTFQKPEWHSAMSSPVSPRTMSYQPPRLTITSL